MNIALYGLGIIGSVWARNLAADGHQVRAWNRTPKPDHPCFCADARSAAQGAQLVAIVVADGPAVMQVLDAVLPVLAPGTVVANHATIGVDEVRAVQARVRAAGCRFLDMPFTGSKIAAEQRQTVYFVGDDDGSLTAVETVYAGISKARLPLGAVGSAMAVKLALNLMIATSYQSLAEGLRLARSAGIADTDFFRCLDLNIAKSGLADLKKPKLLAADWSPQFSVKHLNKDLRHALRLAAASGVSLPQAAQLQAAYAAAEADGLGEADFSVMYQR
ncbi:MAG TPA: NAD(P)-dependent oxidoreductase [Planctomycetes bacterium]|nr:NAD(P)-dependent oxidoreductase [Planctomycetota bacterium]